MPRPSPSHDRFAALLDRHRGIVHKVAATYGRHPEDRRDLAQEIAAQLWRAFPRYDAARPFATWAYRIALNVGISHLRRDSLRRGLVTPYDAHGPEPTDAATLTPEADDRVRALHAVMDRLDPFDRALLVLHLEGYSNPEVGEILGLTATNASTRLSRLRARLRALLDPDAPRPDAP